MQKYTEPEAHRRPQNESNFVDSLTEKERELHKMAERLLGSSYFMDRTHSYKKWQQKQLRP
jgi:hypothetical protein